MTFPILYIADHYKFFHGIETITWFPRIDDNSFDLGIPVIKGALKRENHKEFVFGDEFSELKQENVIWELWVNAMLVAFEPKRGDQFTDSRGESWYVTKVDICDFTTRYRLHTNKVQP